MGDDNLGRFCFVYQCIFSLNRFLCYQISKTRKWSESYSSFGLIKVTRKNRDCAQCLHCSVVIPSASLLPSKLKNIPIKSIPKGRMITSMLCMPKEYDTTWKRRYLIWDLEKKPTLQCSYEAYQIAKRKNPHTIAEKLIKLCAEKMVKIMMGSGQE